MGRIIEKLMDGILEMICMLALMVAVGVMFPVAFLFRFVDLNKTV